MNNVISEAAWAHRTAMAAAALFALAIAPFARADGAAPGALTLAQTAVFVSALKPQLVTLPEVPVRANKPLELTE